MRFVKRCSFFQSLGDIHLGKNGFIARTCLDYLQRGISKTGIGFLMIKTSGMWLTATCHLSREQPGP